MRSVLARSIHEGARMKNKSHISPEIRAALAQHAPEIRRGVLAVADADKSQFDQRSGRECIGAPPQAADTALKTPRKV
jgi:hypothetical protein